MSRDYHLSVEADPVTGVVALVGELTFVTVHAFDDLLREHLPRHPDLVLDVRAVTACDSAGLSALLGTARRAELAEGGVTLLGVRPPLTRMLRLTGVEPMFSFRDEDDDASAAAPAFEGRGEPA
jgi:anti-sigma B factor antagonist